MVRFEVESKARVKDPEELREKLEKIANFKFKIKRADKYFEQEKGYPKKAFRVRQESDDYIVNFKKWIKSLWDEEIVVKQEFELTLTKEELETLLFLFRDLGFKEWIMKDKECEVFEYKKNKKLHMELNKVKKLGWFLEVEYLCQKPEIEKARRLIRQVLRELEIEKNDIDNTGYTKMLWNLKK